MFNKKGQTLVEVVVALGILISVFTAAVSLVTAVSNLALTSKSQTTASALAQKAVGEAKALYEFGSQSTINPYLTSPDATDPDGCNDNDISDEIGVTAPSGFSLTTQICRLSASETAPMLLDNNNFMRVVATVSWTERSASQSYRLVEVVKK